MLLPDHGKFLTINPKLINPNKWKQEFPLIK